MPKVSILMNCYNGDKYLKQAIDSIILQTFKDWQIIFIDNCSTDNSETIAKSYNDNRIQYYKTDKNIPLGKARLFGMKFCVGEYISFLDTDDLWHNSKLQLQINMLDQNQNFAYCYSDYEIIDDKSNHIKYYKTKHNNGYIFNNLLQWYEVGMPTIMIRSSIFENFKESFDSKLSYCPDYDLFMRIALTHEICSIKQNLAKYRILGDSLSMKTKMVQYSEILFVSQKLLKLSPDIPSRFPKEYTHWQAWISKNKADYCIRTNNLQDAIISLKKATILGLRHQKRYELSLETNGLERLKEELLQNG